ncbi:hypothetical protein HUE87_06340 [Candidatus Sulfurimonas marisnigri]|uniref:Uncharacterized protein n=1 Tax=Candidatus Sulfurimonas marisnigri TaxID=2740405 RepID=A0A7S7LXY5_9BACT|nr:hypothetical protein [Candidatus Sulfurimonas marisnigri]QOY53543.1 hypothetical protein HUE87_06340 [Candidatus Sulfurimonas marisnigri]
MIPIINGIMVVLFVLFLVFVFGGYHKNKSAQREADREDQEKKEVNSDSSTESN